MNLFSIASLPFSQQDDAWREQMKAMRQEFETSIDAFTASFADANSNQVVGIGNIVAKVASQRLASEAKTKADADQRLATTTWSVWDNKPLATKLDAGSTSIDLASNTLTLSDGTVIDIATGLKKIDLTV